MKRCEPIGIDGKCQTRSGCLSTNHAIVSLFRLFQRAARASKHCRGWCDADIASFPVNTLWHVNKQHRWICHAYCLIVAGIWTLGRDAFARRDLNYAKIGPVSSAVLLIHPSGQKAYLFMLVEDPKPILSLALPSTPSHVFLLVIEGPSHIDR